MSTTTSITVAPEASLVTLKGDKLVTTSRRVAESFGKRHDHVLRDIDTIVESCVYQERRAPNFGFTSVLVPMPPGLPGTQRPRKSGALIPPPNHTPTS